MKNTRSTMKLLLLSLTFAAIHFSASPMQWIVQPSEQTIELRQQAILTLQEQISASLIDQRKIEAGWFLAKPKESVDAFFTANSTAQVLRALLNLGEYGHASNHLQNFLNRRNDDAAKRHAYNLATTLAMEGCAPALYQLTNYMASCVVANRSLMSQENMDEVVVLAFMGLVATEQASIWFESNFSEDKDLMARVSKAKAGLQAKYAQFLQVAFGQAKADDAYLAAQWAGALQIITNKTERWAASSPVWLALVTFDRYQNLGFDVLTQAQADAFNAVKDNDSHARLEQAVQAVREVKAGMDVVIEQE